MLQSPKPQVLHCTHPSANRRSGRLTNRSSTRSILGWLSGRKDVTTKQRDSILRVKAKPVNLPATPLRKHPERWTPVQKTASRHDERQHARMLVEQSRSMSETCKQVRQESRLAVARAKAIQENFARWQARNVKRLNVNLFSRVPSTAARAPLLVVISTQSGVRIT